MAADGNGDAALALLLHPVHRGGAFVDLARAVDATGVKQDALRGGGLARVDVGNDADIARLAELRTLSELAHSGAVAVMCCRSSSYPSVTQGSMQFRRTSTIVRKGAVRLGHAVSIFTPFDRGAGAIDGVEQLVGQFLLHRLAGTCSRRQ